MKHLLLGLFLSMTAHADQFHTDFGVTEADLLQEVFEPFMTDHVEDAGTGYEYKAGNALIYSGDFPNDSQGRLGSAILSTGTTNVDAFAGIYTAGYNYFLPGFVYRTRWRACLPAASSASATYETLIGFANFGGAGPNYPSGGPFFEYTHSDNGGRWQAVLRQWGAGGDIDLARIDTGRSYDSNCHVFEVAVKPQQFIAWYMDGVRVAYTGTTFPGTSELMYPFSKITGSTQVGAKLLVLDWFRTGWYKVP